MSQQLIGNEGVSLVVSVYKVVRFINLLLGGNILLLVKGGNILQLVHFTGGNILQPDPHILIN